MNMFNYLTQFILERNDPILGKQILMKLFNINPINIIIMNIQHDNSDFLIYKRDKVLRIKFSVPIFNATRQNEVFFKTSNIELFFKFFDITENKIEEVLYGII